MNTYKISYKKPEHGVRRVEADAIDFLNMDTYAFKKARASFFETPYSPE